MSSPNECGPAQHHLDGTVSTASTATLPSVQPADDGTGRPRPVTLIGAKLLHDLIRHGYRVAGSCRGCGAALTSPKSLAAGYGPVCASRVTR